MLQTNGSGALSFTTVQGVPSGSVFCMAVATVPSGYLECNGAAVSRTTYSVLFAVIGTAYGTGNGSSTFNLPDLRGEFVRGFDNGKGTDSGRSIASSQGSQNAQHNHSASATSTAGAHSHSLNYQRKHVEDTGTAAITDIRREGGDGDGGSQTFTNDTTSGFMNNATVSVSTSVSIGNQGGNESRPRNVAMMYVIKI
jgi:microcystin-dependent protein